MALDLDAKARRRVVDQVAAAVMLQAWLDHRRLERRALRTLIDDRPTNPHELQDADLEADVVDDGHDDPYEEPDQYEQYEQYEQYDDEAEYVELRRESSRGRRILTVVVVLLVVLALAAGGTLRWVQRADRPAGIARASRGSS